MIRRAFEILRRQGPVSLYFKVIGELFYRRLFLYQDVLARELELPDTGTNLDVGLLTEDALDEHLALVPYADRQEIVRRLSNGDICSTGRIDGELVVVTWTAAHRAWVEYVGLHILMPKGTVYGYQTFVRGDHRRKGASTDLIRKRRAQLAGMGHTTEIVAAMPENVPAVKFQLAVKREPIGMLRVVWLGPWRWGWATFRRGVDAPSFQVE